MTTFTLKFLFVLATLCVSTWMIWNRFDYPLTGIDDANIFFVYAKNFATWNGFVYNIGGERVEGFSSILWTLVCALVFHLSTKPELTLLLLNIATVAFGVTVALSYIENELCSREETLYARLAWPLIFLACLFTSPPYIVWNTITLMENGIWSTFLLLTTMSVTRKEIDFTKHTVTLSVLFCLLIVTRPEALLWVAVFSMVLFIRKASARGTTPAIKSMLPLLMLTTLTVVGLTVFRLVYFGYPFPNTYYAKVSPSLLYNCIKGALYCSKYCVSDLIVWMCVVAVLLSSMHSIRVLMERSTQVDGRLFLPIIAGTGLLVPLITGGDHFGSSRFYQGIYPLLLLCLLYFINTILPQYVQVSLSSTFTRRQWIVAVSLLSCLVASSFIVYRARTWKSFRAISEMSSEFDIARWGRDTGRLTKDTFDTLPELPSIGVVVAGGIKFSYPGDVIDLMGLNNVRMAHNGGKRIGFRNHAAFEKATFYELQPDVVVVEVVPRESWQFKASTVNDSFENEVLKGLFNDAAFAKSYTYAEIARTDSKVDNALVGWFKKDFLKLLDSSGDFVVQKFEYAAK